MFGQTAPLLVPPSPSKYMQGKDCFGMQPGLNCLGHPQSARGGKWKVCVSFTSLLGTLDRGSRIIRCSGKKGGLYHHPAHGSWGAGYSEGPTRTLQLFNPCPESYLVIFTSLQRPCADFPDSFGAWGGSERVVRCCGGLNHPLLGGRGYMLWPSHPYPRSLLFCLPWKAFCQCHFPAGPFAAWPQAGG